MKQLFCRLISQLGPPVLVHDPFVVAGLGPVNSPFLRYPRIRKLPQENACYIGMGKYSIDLIGKDSALPFLRPFCISKGIMITIYRASADFADDHRPLPAASRVGFL